MDYETEYLYEVCFVHKNWNINSPVSDLTVYKSCSIERDIKVNLSVERDSNFCFILNVEHTQMPKDCDIIIYRKSEAYGSKYDSIKTIKYKENSEANFIAYDSIISEPDQLIDAIEFTYKAEISILGKTFISQEITMPRNLATTITSFSASKGSSLNKTVLNWNVKLVGDEPVYYVVGRKLFNSNDEYTEIYNISGNNTSYFYEDNNIVTGQYYEYNIQAYKESSGKRTKLNNKTDIGFCQNSGIISGNIFYESNMSVPKVKVVLENLDGDKKFQSLESTKSGAAFWNIKYNKACEYFVKKPFSLQMWVKAAIDDNINNSKPVIFEIAQSVSAIISENAENNNEYKILFYNDNDIINTDVDLIVKKGEFFNLTLSTDGKGNYSCYVIDGKESMIKIDFRGPEITDWSTDNKYAISLGTNLNRSADNNFKGCFDDVRFYNTSRDSSDIKRDYNMKLSGDEKNLTGYWTFDDPVATLAFDVSRINGVANENHMTISLDAQKIEVTPDNLLLCGFTDSTGVFIIKGIPYSGNGTNYTIKPIFSSHNFSPGTTTRFVGNNSLVHGGIQFVDISSFDVSGTVHYENTNYPVEGAYLYVDGEQCMRNGEAVTTNSDGNFNISVSLGEHYIQIKKDGHTFVNNGRYPYDSTEPEKKYSFEKPLSHLTFYDNTKVVLAGRVVGGEVESEMDLGFRLSKANIGQAQIKLTVDNAKMNMIIDSSSETALDYTPASEDLIYENPSLAAYPINSSTKVGTGENASTITILTDPKTGEFAALIPPVQYKIEGVTILSTGVKIEAGNNKSSTTTINIDPLTCDSVKLIEGENTHHFVYNGSLIYEYRTVPRIEVTDKGNSFGAFGEKELTYSDAFGEEKIEVYTVDKDNNVNYNFGYPLFVQCDIYDFEIETPL